MSFFGFHPIIEEWFHSRFAAPTEPQQQGWPHIADGRHTLIAAPTGSGKTLTAFLACIDRLLKESIDRPIHNEMRVVYVSPLRALSNDMHRNLELPLQEITELAKERDHPIPAIRVGLRTGDTPSYKRQAIVKKPPHLLVTTPESLYLMLTSDRGREALSTVETVIVDEIHALIRDKRGSHFALTMERLEALCERRIQRVGLSATQRPIEQVAEFLTGHRNKELCAKLHTVPDTFQFAEKELSPDDSDECEIVNVGHGRELDLGIETPLSELSAICSHEQWAEVNEQIVQLIKQHRSTLIFVNTRRLAERVTFQLTELLGEGTVSSHHGSLAADTRHTTEQGLKTGELKAVVATGSLELGLDIGYIDLVIQIGSPRSIATFLQRIGRSGHSLGLIPKGRLFALTRDELMESMALIRAVGDGVLDRIIMPEAPLDVLAQQIVAEASAQEWQTEELYDLFRQSYPYRNLSEREYHRTIEYLSEGISSNGGRSRVYLHHDHVGQRIRARKGAKITAVSNGGAIPEIASYRVVAEPEGTVVGSLDEEFAVESQRGDVFLLGNTSWRILYVRGGDVRVIDAEGAPPTIPFWEGEAPGRTFELSQEVSRLREDLEQRLDDPTDAEAWLREITHCSEFAAEKIVEYAAAQKAAIGLLPTQKRVVFERFFDESGGMQMLVHAPFGQAITKAWGFSMRKRFCRSFDFELQATADDDGFILSLGPQHSFPIESLFPMLTRENSRSLLEQAVLQVPMFQVRWRWNVTRALLVHRMQNGHKVPPPLQRFRSDDLLTAVFPKLTGCQEEHTGDHELPDHPLTIQTMEDCLTEAMDLPGLHRTLEQIQNGEITLIARDTREPSPFAYELLNSAPYTFLDGGEAQERRARAVATPRSINIESVRDLGRLDAGAIDQVREEAAPTVRNADELHDALMGRIVLPIEEGIPWQRFYETLEREKRATTISLSEARSGWVATERLPAALAAFPDGNPDPPVIVPKTVQQEWSSVDARVAMVRGLIETCGPITAAAVADRVGITVTQADGSLVALEGEGLVLQGQFTPPEESSASDTIAGSNGDSESKEKPPVEWCHRRLLSRIHRLTLQGLRKQIQPVSVPIFLRHLTRVQGLHPESQSTGTNGLFETIAQLQGLDIPAQSWEQSLLPLRLNKYQSAWLDELCLTGEVGWGRLYPPRRDPDQGRAMASLTRVAPISLWIRDDIGWLCEGRPELDPDTLSGPAQEVLEILQQNGAQFPNDMLNQTRMLPSQLNDVLGELVTRGFLTADGFSGLRQLLSTKGDSTRSVNRRRGIVRQRSSVSASGRWSLWGTEKPSEEEQTKEERRETVEQWAWQLLRRWGVIFRDLLTKESGAPQWYELLQVYRKLEARGEIRGGRFISGVGGEQFALGDTIRQLRQLRDESENINKKTFELLILSGADPLNLVGILTKDARIPATAANRVVFFNGEPVASKIGGTVTFLKELAPSVKTDIEERLTKNETTLIITRPAVQTGFTKDLLTESVPESNNGSEKQKSKERPNGDRYPNGIPRPRIS